MNPRETISRCGWWGRDWPKKNRGEHQRELASFPSRSFPLQDQEKTAYTTTLRPWWLPGNWRTCTVARWVLRRSCKFSNKVCKKELLLVSSASNIYERCRIGCLGGPWAHGGQLGLCMQWKAGMCMSAERRWWMWPRSGLLLLAMASFPSLHPRACSLWPSYSILKMYAVMVTKLRPPKCQLQL